MNKERFYKIELILKDTFEDSELDGEDEMSTSEIDEFLSNKLPYGFEIVKKSIVKLEGSKMI